MTRTWRDEAACAGVDPDLFFPRRGDMATLRQAKAICTFCPVQLECLETAIVNKEAYGVWGGVTHRDFLKRRTALMEASEPTRVHETDNYAA